MRKIEDLKKEFGTLKNYRRNWEHLWEELEQWVAPQNRDFNRSNSYDDEKGQKNYKLHNTTATLAWSKLSSSLVGTTCSPSEPWFSLALHTIDEELKKAPETRQWLQTVEAIIYDMLQNPATNFYASMHEFFQEIVLYGVGCLLVQERKDKKAHIFTKIVPINELYICENEYCEVDTIYRRYPFTLKKLFAQFPQLYNNPEMPELQVKLEKNPHETIYLIHAILPAGEDFESYYYMEDKPYIISHEILKDNPYIVCRWSKIAGEMYGRSPAMIALPDTKVANKLTKLLLLATQLGVVPPWQISNDSHLKNPNLKPNAINIYSSTYGNISEQGYRPMVSGLNFPVGFDREKTYEQRIMDIFQQDMLGEQKQARMSQMEVAQSQNDRMKMLSPQLGRLHVELFHPLLKRLYFLLKKKRGLPEKPSNLADTSIKPIYISPLGKAQEAVKVAEAQQGIQVLQMAGQINPNEPPPLALPNLYNYIIENLGLPVDIIKTGEEIQQEKQQEQENMQNMQTAQMAQAGAGAMKTMAETSKIQQEMGVGM